jgi:hypothetical protein
VDEAARAFARWRFRLRLDIHNQASFQEQPQLPAMRISTSRDRELIGMALLFRADSGQDWCIEAYARLWLPKNHNCSTNVTDHDTTLELDHS